MWGKGSKKNEDEFSTTLTITFMGGRVETITSSNPEFIYQTEQQAFTDPNVVSVNAKVNY